MPHRVTHFFGHDDVEPMNRHLQQHSLQKHDPANQLHSKTQIRSKHSSSSSRFYTHNKIITFTMSSLTTQESSNTQPENPVNPGDNKTSTFKGDPSVPFKTGASTDPTGLSTSVDKVSAISFSPLIHSLSHPFLQRPNLISIAVCIRPTKRL